MSDQRLFVHVYGGILVAVLALLSGVQSQLPPYPHTPERPDCDTLHNVVVCDPYRWLEDLDHPEVERWVEAQRQYARNYLDAIPWREALRDTLRVMLQADVPLVPYWVQGTLYYTLAKANLNQPILVRYNPKGHREEVLIDPNQWSDDGTVSLMSLHFDRDGRYLAYQVAHSGSDWRVVRVMDLHTNEVLDDSLTDVKFSNIAWSKDGFYYSRFIGGEGQRGTFSELRRQAIYYHKIGTSQLEDQRIYLPRAVRTYVQAHVTDDGRWLIVHEMRTTSGNRVLVKRNHTQDTIRYLVSHDDKRYQWIGIVGDTFLYRTNDGFVNYGVVGLYFDSSGEVRRKVFIPERNEALTNAWWFDGIFVLHYLKDAKSHVVIRDAERERAMPLPGPGTVRHVRWAKDERALYYVYTSFIHPNAIYRYKMVDHKSEVYLSSHLPFHTEDYITEEYWYPSHDGTRIHVFVSRHKEVDITEPQPVLLYGYGGFNIPITPSFSVERAAWMRGGGVYVVANLRGGGEYGEAWHRQGTKSQKQNVFYDFQWAAQWLIDTGWTSSDLLAIEGRSNGGLLIGACITQRPDLYRVAVPVVGVLDMLRYHLFTIGWAWASDYGISTRASDFSYLRRYSPVHNVVDAHYPSTLIMTADHDDRVVPSHSYKFAAQLQKHQRASRPVLLRVEHGAGHGAGRSKAQHLAEMTDKLAFIWYEMGRRPQWR